VIGSADLVGSRKNKVGASIIKNYLSWAVCVICVRSAWC